ncbi:Skp family chaperone for outer membrane proteins [Bradyrhizobium betae]|nr:Skp family chaperone for outer membrane proteins [Bradyrhizobium betae]
MSASRRAALLVAAAGFFLLTPSHAQAQWWKRAPVDFEECADAAEKAATKTEKTSALADCNAKFAGRRKTGGGYSYYDFLQDRTFDIAGPNPTPDEQKKIDESYTAYLANQRRSNEAAQAAMRQQREQQERQAQQLQQVALRTEVERVPVPVERPKVQQAIGPRPKGPPCAKGSFSCEWPRLSEGLNDLKKLFNPTPSKPAKKG